LSLLCVKLVGAVLLYQFIVQTEDQNRGSPDIPAVFDGVSPSRKTAVPLPAKLRRRRCRKPAEHCQQIY
jgi:hypothetical protein